MSNRVLIADDHPAIRFLIRSLIVSEGFTACAEAADGANAVELAIKSHPDLILLDYSMPGMDGGKAATVLKRLMPQVPIILFTLHDAGVGQKFHAGLTWIGRPLSPKAEIGSGEYQGLLMPETP